MRRLLALLAVGSTIAVVGAVAPATAATVRLTAVMTGAEERPGPGDPDGIGRAVVTIDESTGQLCEAVQFTNVALPATGFHIHLGPAGSAGPVVVPFAPPTGNVSYQCTSVAPTLLHDIAVNPAKYYTNLHDAAFPGGAIRGQLQPVDSPSSTSSSTTTSTIQAT